MSHLPSGAGFQLSGMASYGVASYCAALAQLLDARRSKPSAQPLQLQRGTNPASLNGGGCNVDEQAADSGSCAATGSAANTAPCVRVIVRMRAADSGAAWPLAPAVQGWLHTVAHAELELEGSDAGGITSSVEDTLREEALSIMRWCPGGTATRCNNQLLKMLGLSASVDSLRLPTPETDRERDPYGLMSPSGEQESVFGISDETAAEVVDPTWETQAVGGFEFRFMQLGSPAEVTATGVQSLSLMGSGDALYAAMSAAVSQKPRQLLAVQLLKRQQQRAQTLKHLQRHKRKEHMSQQELQCPRLRRAEVEVLNLADYPLLPQYCPRPYIGDYSISLISTLDWYDDNLIAPQLDGDGCHLNTDILSIFLGDVDDNAVKGMAPSPEVREVDWTRVPRYGSVAHMLERCGATGTAQAGWVCPCPACRGSRAGGDATGSCGCGDGASYGCALEAGEMLLTSLTAGAVWL